MSGDELDGDGRRRLDAGLENVGMPSRLPMSALGAGPGAGPDRDLLGPRGSDFCVYKESVRLLGRAFLAYLPKSRLSNDY